MSVTTFIALRYLRPRRGQMALSILSILSLIGVSLSVYSFFVIHSVMNGFSSYLEEALVGFNAHLVITSPEDPKRESNLLDLLKSQDGVTEILPVVELDGILITGEGVAAGTRIRGVPTDFLNERFRSMVTFFEEEEGVDHLLHLSDRKDPGIIIGEELFNRLQLVPDVDQRVDLVNPLGEVGPSGEMEPTERSFKVLGLLSSGFYDFDARYAFIDRDESARLEGANRGPGTSEKILVRLAPSVDPVLLQEDLGRLFPELKASTWKELNRRLLSALKLERLGMFLLLSIVIFIATFNILALMTLLGLLKERDMSVLFCSGMDRRQIILLYIKVGALLGTAGTILGLGLGLTTSFWLKGHPLPLPPAYYLNFLPVDVEPRIIAILALMSPLFAMVASLWPALKASHMRPVELLRST